MSSERAAEPTNYDIVSTMENFGGSFIKALAKAWQYADTENKAKLEQAFPEYWKQYREFYFAASAR